jgi:hypothetical protein
LSDTDGQLGVDVSVNRAYGSEVGLHDGYGKPRATLRVSSSGAASLFMGELGREVQPTVGPSLKLGVTSDGPSLQFGKDNSVFWSAP